MWKIIRQISDDHTFYVMFIDLDYCYKSVATQIPLIVGLVPFSITGIEHGTAVYMAVSSPLRYGVGRLHIGFY